MAPQANRIEIVAAVTLLALVVVGCFVILRPFLAALSWSVILTLATWPAYHWLETRLGGRRTLAALLMTSLLAFAFILPFALVWPKLAQNVGLLAGEGRALLHNGPPGPPACLADIPVVGARAQAAWQEYADDLGALADQASVYVPATASWLLAALRGLPGAGAQRASDVLLLSRRPRRRAQAANRRRADRRRSRRALAAGRGRDHQKAWSTASSAPRSPRARSSALACGWQACPPPSFSESWPAFISILPGGAMLVWLPAAIWLFYGGATGWGVFTLLWGALVVGSVDNVLKPHLIGRSSALPLLLVFLGIAGGAMAFGFLGIFLGPTILAVGQTLLQAWTPDGREHAA